MSNETYRLTLPAWVLACVQVALLEADLQARNDNRETDSNKYMQVYKYIGTEKRGTQA